MIMGYDAYIAYLSEDKLHNDPSTYYQDTLQSIIDEQFETSSNFKYINLLDRDTGVATQVGVRLEPTRRMNIESNIKDDFFKVVFKNFDYPVILGDVIAFDSFRWMIIDISSIESGTQACLIQRCNAKLNFIYSNNDVLPTVTDTKISLNCIAEKKMYDIESDRFYTIPNNEIKVKVPNNSNSRKIKFDVRRGTRFLMGNPAQSFHTKGIDSISMVRTDIDDSNEDNGILLLTLQIDGLNTKKDNVAEMYAIQYCYGGS
jgi:hypothetical protein